MSGSVSRRAADLVPVIIRWISCPLLTADATPEYCYGGGMWNMGYRVAWGKEIRLNVRNVP